ncbi:MAG: ABC transporter [Verrucomicrobiales bacterium]|nr:ABC transporter [Verrucomicrobiales bacterium]
MENIVKANKLSRWYGIVMGLNNISFTIPAGLTGLVGPNGAGKSTLIKIITGQIRPSSGELRVFGERPWNNPRLLNQVGYCPEDDALPDDLQPLQWLISLGLISGLPRREVQPQCENLLNRVKLDRVHWQKRLGEYSKGMRQRVKLAQALLHQPRLLVLDEPMNGLDPMGRQEMQQILKSLAAQGTSILISSHILPELEALCQNVLILNWGRVLASGSQAELRSQLQGGAERFLVRCSDPEKLARVLFDAGLLRGFQVDDQDGGLRLRLRDPEAFHDRLPALLAEHDLALHEMRSEDRSLQNIFDRVTQP